MNFPDKQHSSVLSQFVAGEIQHMLNDSTGRRLLEAYAGFLWILPQVPSTFAEFAVINHSSGYDYMQCLISSPSESPN